MAGFVARSLLSSIFISGGLGAVQAPGPRSATVINAAKKLNVNLAEAEADTVVKLNGATMVGAGATVALGIFPRLSAATLIASLVPTTLAGHPFWEMEAGQARSMNKIQFFKNLSIIGGLVSVLLSPGKAKKVTARRR
ncbi:hypothetical protein GCM10025789_05780 [Tessaracoccus lubricantis]|uniref:DoxX family protein n=1 Tax=Tessaracoccus lubricantis TaxID=545543 RepID=A0ABP9F3A9_9ACTN